VRKQQRFVSII